jgi:hypothetical protein
MYKIQKSIITGEEQGVIRLLDGAYIPFSQDNTDYQAYLKFLAEGGQPLPADSE